MDYDENRKWAIVSQITSFGWLLAVIVTFKKKKSSYLSCYLNNGLIIFVYGVLYFLLKEAFDLFYGFQFEQGTFIWAYQVYYSQNVNDGILGVLSFVYILWIGLGIYFSIKGEKRRIPFIFKVKLFEKLNVFKADENVQEFNSINKMDKANVQEVREALSSTVKKVRNLETGFKEKGRILDKKLKDCPSCGKKIAVDDMFCAFCGEKFDLQSTKEEGRRISHKDRLTVTEYIAGIKDYKCEYCGEIVKGNDKFCPSCGRPVVIKIMPSTCSKCGHDLTAGYAFCPSCGSETKPVELQIKCKKCGADLLYGKEFCVNCGAKVIDEDD